MAYNIVYKKSIERDLKKIGKAEAAKILDSIESELPQKAESYPVLKGQFAGLRKYRMGDFQVIFALIGKEFLILRIGHRRDVYKHKI